jgi:endonuclease YncB( thermonuclease family)
MYAYAFNLLRVIDGDTVEGICQLGFNVAYKLKARLKGINAPELSTPAGVEAKEYLERMLTGKVLEVQSTKLAPHDKFGGRYDLTLWASELGKSQINVNLAMIDSGHALKYSA